MYGELLSNSKKNKFIIHICFLQMFSNNRKLQNCTIKYLNYDKIFPNTIDTYIRKL